MSATILAIDDVPEMCKLLSTVLSREGYLVQTAETASTAIKKIKTNKPDLILMDIMLPGISGAKLTSYLKESADYCDIPVILLTAKDSDADMVDGLKGGADDYVKKPFNYDVLNARVGALLRRFNPNGIDPNKVASFGPFKLLKDCQQAYAYNEPVKVSPSEFVILNMLVAAEGKIVSREQLLERIDTKTVSNKRLVDVHITSLRKKLGQTSKHLRTVHGKGYKIISEV